MRPSEGARKSQEHHAGYFQPDSFPSFLAMMPADSWHGREPKITQTAGVGGVPWTQAMGCKSRHLESHPGCQ